MRTAIAALLLLAACGPLPSDEAAADAGGNPCPCLMPDSGVRGIAADDGGLHLWHAPDAG